MRSMICAAAGIASRPCFCVMDTVIMARAPGAEAHMRYLRELVLPDPAMKVILEDYLMAISAAQERIQRCETAMIDRLPSWRLKPAVDALMAFKGFQLLAAMITVSELGALQRFDHPRQVMAYLGLVPSESTSSDKRRQGAYHQNGQLPCAVDPHRMCPALRGTAQGQ